LSVTKFRPGEQTITEALTIFISYLREIGTAKE